MAKRYFASQGAIVETAYNTVRLVPMEGQPGKLRPLSTHHDIFGVWDLIAITWLKTRDMGEPARVIAFVQVTDLNNMYGRRIKILASGFPCTSEDKIMAYLGGARFRILRGPDFQTKGAEDVKVPPPVKKAKKKREAVPA